MKRREKHTYRFNPHTLRYEKVFVSLRSRIRRISFNVLVGVVLGVVLVVLGMQFMESPKERALERELAQYRRQTRRLNDRVERAVEAWRAGDIEAYGRISTESWQSSVHNWETGSLELNTLCEIILRQDGVYGGRFSGAGFKGCCMALIDPAYEESIAAAVRAAYLEKFPALADKYLYCGCHSADGVSL